MGWGGGSEVRQRSRRCLTVRALPRLAELGRTRLVLAASAEVPSGVRPRASMTACYRSFCRPRNSNVRRLARFQVGGELLRRRYGVSPGSGARVLVVADEPAILRVVQTNLAGHHFRVETAGT